MPQHPTQNLIGEPFIELQSVDSTNNYALARVHAGLASHGEAYFAWEQWAGKGQRGRQWVAEKGQNIILSVVANPYPLKVSEQFWLSAAVAVAVYDYFSKYAGEETAIKWPNDLYWQDRKAGGILIESILGRDGEGLPEWKWAIIGVGVNINQVLFPENVMQPVSLKQITGKEWNSVIHSRELCGHLQNRFHQLHTKGIEGILEDYRKHLYKKGKVARLRKDNRVFDALIQDVTTSGKLVIKHAIEEEVSFGEVEWVSRI